jgi:hypothetical protein
MYMLVYYSRVPLKFSLITTRDKKLSLPAGQGALGVERRS